MQRRVLISLFLASIVFAPVRWSFPAEDAQTVKSKLLQAPAGRLPVKIDLRGMTVLPNGRLITPFGKQVKVAPHPMASGSARTAKPWSPLTAARILFRQAS